MKTVIKVIVFFLLLIFVLALITRLFSYKKEYTTEFDNKYWQKRYLESQWVVPDSKNSIGDDGLYAYVSWEYIHGSDPTLLNAEIPPLGKYIIGLGEVVFKNQNVLVALIGLVCLGVFYLLNLEIFKNGATKTNTQGKILAFLPVFLFSIEPLFYEQLRAPYLDLIYLLFLLLTLLFALKHKYVLSAVFLGCFAATKYPAGSLFLFIPILFWVIIYDKKNLFKFILSFLLWPVVFLLAYLAFFIKGGNIMEFLGVQKWIAVFYFSGAKSIPGIVYPMILSGNWNTWFGGLKKVGEWNILWPISFIFSFIALIVLCYGIKDKRDRVKNKGVILITLWMLSYLVFLSFTPVFPRYLLLLLPFMYNLLIWFLANYVFQRY